MATNSMIPYSNPAGNNQTTPGAVSTLAPVKTGSLPMPNPTNPTAPVATNPFVPATGIIPSSQTANPISAPPVTTTGGYGVNVAPTTPGGVASNNLQKQFTDIYGQGVGASLFNLLNNMSGTDSTALSEYEQSLQPQEAAASANLDAAEGAAGVSQNSSVAGIAQSNLQSQETAAVAGEAEQLTMNDQKLTAQILEGTEGQASTEVSTTPLSIFGDVMSQVGSDAATLFSGGGLPSFGGGGGGGSPVPVTPSAAPIGTASSGGGIW